MDHFWRWFLNAIIYGIFSRLFTYNDRRVVDGGVDAVAFSTVGSGRYLSHFQTALLQVNLLFRCWWSPASVFIWSWGGSRPKGWFAVRVKFR